MRERSIAAGAMAYKQLKTEVSDKALARFSAKKLMSQHKNPPALVKLSSKLMLESREAGVSKSSKSAKTNKPIHKHHRPNHATIKQAPGKTEQEKKDLSA
jgi:hypothetical protein